LYHTRYMLWSEIQSLYSSRLICLIFHQKYKNISRFVGCIPNTIWYSLVNSSSFPSMMCLTIKAPFSNFSLSIRYLITQAWCQHSLLDRSGCRRCSGANWFKALSVKGYNVSKVDRRKASVLCVIRCDTGTGNTVSFRSRVCSGTGTGAGLLYPSNTVPFSTVLWVCRCRGFGQVSDH
jgi:hypothetical protein